MPSLVGDYSDFQYQTSRLTALLASTAALAPVHRKVIAEITLLRLAILIENNLKLIFCKLACGAVYLDGSAPRLLAAAQKNIPAAVTAMQKLNRTRPRPLPWNDGKEIRDNIVHVIDGLDPCVQHMKNYAAFLTEVRYLRNHIAHRNSNSRANFVKLVRKYYGARVPGVTCGNLLLTPRIGKPPLLERHVASARIMIRDLVRA
jgi:hypothetical protein